MNENIKLCFYLLLVTINWNETHVLLESRFNSFSKNKLCYHILCDKDIQACNFRKMYL